MKMGEILNQILNQGETQSWPLCKFFVQKSFNSKISTRLMYAIQSIPIEHLILNFFFFLNEIREFDN